MDAVILEFTANTEGLKHAADQLLALGQISKEQYAQFSKANQDAQNQMKAVTKAQLDIDNAVKKTTGDAKNMSDQFRQLTTVIAGEVLKEAIAEFAALGQEMVAVDAKSKSLKVQLKELKASLAEMELAGDDSSETFIRMSVEAAKLEDQIGDTNARIRAMASDTRGIDLMVESVRGVTAAFSVAQGASALFGEENEDLQKALLKVQAATAILMGTQELAEIVTKKGGITTTAYGFALKAVEFIQKQFAISSAAAWAAATAGLTILIAGVVLLYNSLSSATEASEKLAQAEADRKKKFSEGLSEQLKAIDDLDARQENELKRKKVQQATDEELFQFQKRQHIERLSLIGELQRTIDYNRETNAIDDKTYTNLSTELERERLDTLLNLRKKFQVEAKKIDLEKQSETDNVEAFRLPEKPKVEKEVKELLATVQETINMEKVPDIKVPLTLQPKDGEDLAAEFKMQLEKAMPYVQQFAELTATIFSAIRESNQRVMDEELSKLEAQKQKELQDKELTEKQKEEIDKKYRRSEARIRAENFDKNKQAKIAEATINGMVALTQLLAQTPPPNPLFFSGAALIAIQTGIALAMIGSQKAPAFAKGTKKAPPGFKLVGEEGPELINDGGGYAIITHPESKKIMENYGIPSMPAFSPPMPHAPADVLPEAKKEAAMDYDKLGTVIADKLKDNPQTVIRMDKNGISIHVMEKGRKVEHLNNQYEAG